MRVPLSYFLNQAGNGMTLEERIRQTMKENDFPIILTTEQDVELETCNNEQELRLALGKRGID